MNSAMKDKQSAKHVLIVDDEMAIVYVFQRYFEMRGFRVSTAYDADSALSLAKVESIDALVTDYRMPGLTGGELVARLKDIKPDLPAIIVSGYSHEIDANFPGVRIVGKPIDPTILVTSVQEMLADAETARNLQVKGD
jgi:CheY-like chemotaxis protein